MFRESGKSLCLTFIYLFNFICLVVFFCSTPGLFMGQFYLIYVLDETSFKQNCCEKKSYCSHDHEISGSYQHNGNKKFCDVTTS